MSYGQPHLSYKELQKETLCDIYLSTLKFLFAVKNIF